MVDNFSSLRLSSSEHLSHVYGTSHTMNVGGRQKLSSTKKLKMSGLTFLDSLAARETQTLAVSLPVDWGVHRTKDMYSHMTPVSHHIPGVLDPGILGQTASNHFQAISKITQIFSPGSSYTTSCIPWGPKGGTEMALCRGGGWLDHGCLYACLWGSLKWKVSQEWKE